MINKIKDNMGRSNKALYEKIMRNVSREVKRALNEDSDFEQRYYTYVCSVKAIRELFKREGIDSLYIDKEYSRIDDYLYLSRVFIDPSSKKLTLYVSEDYYPEDPDVTDFVYTFSELENVGINPNDIYIAVRDQLGDPYPDIETKYNPFIG